MSNNGHQRIICPRCGRATLGEWSKGHFISNHHGKLIEFRGTGIVLVRCPQSSCVSDNQRTVVQIGLDKFTITIYNTN